MKQDHSNQDLETLSKKLAQSWMRIQAIKQGHFKLASGRTSRLYFDLRLCFGDPDCFNLSITVLDRMIQDRVGWESIDGVVGIPTAGLPFAATLSFLRKKPLFYPRKPKEHGLRKSIEGGNVTNKHLVIIDDLISTGHSKIPAITTLRANGAMIKHICVLLDRELGGKEVIEENGLQLHAACVFSQLQEWFNLPDP